MVKSMKEAMAGLRRDIDRWEADLAKAETEGYGDLATKIRCWIAEGKMIIADSGY